MVPSPMFVAAMVRLLLGRRRRSSTRRRARSSTRWPPSGWRDGGCWYTPRTRAPGPSFQSPGLDLCRLVHDPRRIADRDPSLLHRPPPRRNGGTVFRQHPGGVGHCSPAHPQQRGRFPSSKRIVQICAILLSRPSGGRRRRELVGVRLNDRPLQFPRPAMEAAKPGSRSRSTKVFCGWQGRRAARRPSSRRPSRFPRPRVPLRGAHINPCGPSGGQQALHQYQTQGDAHEATRSGIARPDGGRAWAGSAPAPVSKLRAPGFHTTAQAPRTPEQRDT